MRLLTCTALHREQRPILLKGHERPLTQVRFNREGDLLYSTGKDRNVCVWFSHNGERLGTYRGHNGAVWGCDINFHTSLLLTASSDLSAKLWDCETGKELYSFVHTSVVRSVAFAEGDRMMCAVTDDSFGKIPTIYIYNLAEDIKDRMSSYRIISVVVMASFISSVSLHCLRQC